ncbi:GFA family protein [Sandaracinobacteroides hominis]
MKLSGGCHCGAVRFEAEAADDVRLLDCNCSVCSMTGFLHLIVDKADFRLLSGEAELTAYRFGTGAALHLFCRVCGVKSFYHPRSHPDGISINAHALDGDGWRELPVDAFDGRNWEQARAAL